MKARKSQGLSVNTIIIAALALGVLIVLIVIFTGGIGKTSQNLGSCILKGGQCQLPGGKCPEGYPIQIFVSGECEKSPTKNLCCIKSENEEQTKK
ncbi:hypothetical protein HY637_03245 [Candidatus Woesearchaeota archaeon]|nr:hypothetical protein [Candidatus Woesearchaeota archaeon]